MSLGQLDKENDPPSSKRLRLSLSLKKRFGSPTRKNEFDKAADTAQYTAQHSTQLLQNREMFSGML